MLVTSLLALVFSAPPTPTPALIAELPACSDEECPAFKALVARGSAIWPDLEPIVAPPTNATRPPDELARFWSIGLCATLKLEPCATHLERILTVGPEIRLRAASTFALAAIRGRAAAPHLHLACTDVDANVRFEAASAIGGLGLGDPDTLKALADLLSDRDADVRRAAIEALGLSRNPDAAPLVVGRLKNDTLPMNRGFAAIALGQLKAVSQLAELVQRLGAEKDPEALAACAWALGELGDRTAVPPLETLFDHPETTVRDAAKAAVAQLTRVPEKPPRDIPREGPNRKPAKR